MSETVHYKGKLKEIEVDSIEEFAKEYFDKELPNYYESYTEMLDDEDDFFIHNDKLYEIINFKDIDPYDDIFEMNKNMEFTLKYYNGGCGFKEALGYAFENQER